MLCQFLVYSKVIVLCIYIHTHTYTHISFSQSFPMLCYRILNLIPWAIQQDLVVYILVSVYMQFVFANLKLLIYPSPHPLPPLVSINLFSMSESVLVVNKCICIIFQIPHISDMVFVFDFSRSVMSDSLQPHELQHVRPPCLSPTPGVHSDSHPSSQ